MTDHTIQSQFLNEKIVIKVYEPEHFDPLYENQVCIMQDGDDYFHLGRIATVSDRLHEEQDIVNTTFVGIPYTDRYDRWRKYYPDGEQFTAYKRFLQKEVVPLVDELLPLNPLGTKRALIGDSLAATISLLTAIDFPELFHYVIMQSPLVDDKVLHFVENFTGNQRPEIYHTIGLKETNVPTTKHDVIDFVQPNKRLAALIKDRFPIYKYVENEEGNHTWKYWQKELPDILIEVFG